MVQTPSAHTGEPQDEPKAQPRRSCAEPAVRNRTDRPPEHLYRPRLTAQSRPPRRSHLRRLPLHADRAALPPRPPRASPTPKSRSHPRRSCSCAQVSRAAPRLLNPQLLWIRKQRGPARQYAAPPPLPPSRLRRPRDHWRTDERDQPEASSPPPWGHEGPPHPGFVSAGTSRRPAAPYCTWSNQREALLTGRHQNPHLPRSGKEGLWTVPHLIASAGKRPTKPWASLPHRTASAAHLPEPAEPDNAPLARLRPPWPEGSPLRGVVCHKGRLLKTEKRLCLPVCRSHQGVSGLRQQSTTNLAPSFTHAGFTSHALTAPSAPPEAKPKRPPSAASGDQCGLGCGRRRPRASHVT